MAVRIRLRRMGAKKRPFYRLVVADSRNARDGRFIEILGHYNPLADPPELKIDVEKARKWLGKGASPSETAKRLMKQAGVYDATETQTEAATEQDSEEAQEVVDEA